MRNCHKFRLKEEALGAIHKGLPKRGDSWKTGHLLKAIILLNPGGRGSKNRASFRNGPLVTFENRQVRFTLSCWTFMQSILNTVMTKRALKFIVGHMPGYEKKTRRKEGDHNKWIQGDHYFSGPKYGLSCPILSNILTGGQILCNKTYTFFLKQLDFLGLSLRFCQSFKQLFKNTWFS